MADVRLIDANALHKAVKKWLPQDPCGREEKEFPFETDICVSMLMEIEEAPTIDAEPVRHGRWAFDPGVDYCYKCSECKYEAPPYLFGDRQMLTNYCPNCGVKMGLRTDG